MSRKSTNEFLKNYFVNLPSNLQAHYFQQIKHKENCASLPREGPGWAEQCELSANGKQPLVLGAGSPGTGGAGAALEPQWAPGPMGWKLQEDALQVTGTHSWGAASSTWEAGNGRGGKESSRCEWGTGALVYSSGLCLRLEPVHI